jgi:hypothetical protein
MIRSLHVRQPATIIGDNKPPSQSNIGLAGSLQGPIRSMKLLAKYEPERFLS